MTWITYTRINGVRNNRKIVIVRPSTERAPIGGFTTKRESTQAEIQTEIARRGKGRRI